MFISFQAPQLTEAQQWAQVCQTQSQGMIVRLFRLVQSTYNGLWDQKDTNPQGAMDRIAALGTGAQSAFQAHAAAVQYLLTTLPLFDGTTDMIAQAQTWQIPAGWTITFNPDGSANVTPPAQT